MKEPHNRDSNLWQMSQSAALSTLSSGQKGLSEAEAKRRLLIYGTNEIRREGIRSTLRIFINQIKSPLLLLLFFAAAVSGLEGQWSDAGIVSAILILTASLSLFQEAKAENTLKDLRARLQKTSTVIRDGRSQTIHQSQIVPGDVIELSAGNVIPADGIILSASDFFVNEAVLTGESFPSEKIIDPNPTKGEPRLRTDAVFLGSSVRSGIARFLVLKTGQSTAYGGIASFLAEPEPETEFENGLRQFGYLILSFMTALTVLIFFINVAGGRPAVETLLFSVALAVGLSPELLPAILTVNLAKGARRMAQNGVLVRRLNAIEDLGSMEVLCTDKTGTLTEGVLRMEGAFDCHGAPSKEVLHLAAFNSLLQTGLKNPLDEAIIEASPPPTEQATKLGEVPYDFDRKRLSVAAELNSERVLITKGAFASIMSIASNASGDSGFDAATVDRLNKLFEGWSEKGIRVLALATRTLLPEEKISLASERDMTIRGFLTFLDRPKEGVDRSILDLASMGASIKLITGDNRLVASFTADAIGLPGATITLGEDLKSLSGPALDLAAKRADIFAEVNPSQKESIVRALRKSGFSVGFLGDGVNDVPAMRAADVSISVDSAVDAAKDAADLVLLEKSLNSVRNGIEEGRRTFANTLKYILITMSANLGNMISMAAASVFLPFLPLAPGQILLNNFMSDIPALGLAGDTIDRETVLRPQRWSMKLVASFMIVFGLMSSLFDFITFAALMILFGQSENMFRTGWFLESLLTELVIIFIVRTKRPIHQSAPSPTLIWLAGGVALSALALPYTRLGHFFGFAPLPVYAVVLICLIVAAYALASEKAKHTLFAWLEKNGAGFRS